VKSKKIDTLAVSDDGKTWLARVTTENRTWYEVVNNETLVFPDFVNAKEYFMELTKKEVGK